MNSYSDIEIVQGQVLNAETAYQCLQQSHNLCCDVTVPGTNRT